MDKFYIYNFRQNRFFIQQGLNPIDCGVGKKGDPYLVFIRDDQSNEVFKKWIASTDEKLIKNN